MEGRWGRRVYGSVRRSALTTRFALSLETRGRKKISYIIFAENEDLARDPDLYGDILDTMVQKMDNAFNNTNGDHT